MTTHDQTDLAARKRPQDPSRRAYRAGMIVRYDGRRWEVDAVEFWGSDEKLHLRELDGAGHVRTREEWARNVEFSPAQPEPKREKCGNYIHESLDSR